MPTYFLNDDVKEIFSTEGDAKSNFFGYYYTNPLDKTSQKLIAHRIDFDGRDVSEKDVAEIGVWDIGSCEFHSLGYTSALNLQQGSMAQWLPGSNDEKVIYNDVKDGKAVSVILDIENGNKKVLPYSIYALSPDGKFALSQNYERLYYCRPGYNYLTVKSEKLNKPVSDDDGIFKIDLETEKVTQLISTEKLVNDFHRPDMDGVDNWLEHIILNPSGTRFAFLHRWMVEGFGHKTRLFTADIDGTNLHMFPDSGFYSHMGWKNDEVFTIWGMEQSKKAKAVNFVNAFGILQKTIGPIYRFVRRNFVKNIDKVALPTYGYLNMWDKSDRVEVLGKGVLTEDGHNTWTRDERYMLTDTYADNEGFRHLLLYDNENNEVTEIGKFYSPYNECGYRCDLHPRFDHSENLVIIDSAHNEGKRQMYVYDISKLKN